MSILEINSRLSTILATAEADLHRLVMDAGKAIAHELGTDTVSVVVPSSPTPVTMVPSTGTVSVSGVPALIELAQEMEKSVGIAFAKEVKAVEAAPESLVVHVKVDVEEIVERVESWFRPAEEVAPATVTDDAAAPEHEA